MYEHIAGHEDPHLVDFYGESLPGCKKMDVCGSIEQGDSIKLRVFDNMARTEPEVKVFIHAGDRKREAEVTNIPGTHAYEFSVGDSVVQAQIVEITFDGVPISQSPVQVEINAPDCEAIWGENSDRVPNPAGDCVW